MVSVFALRKLSACALPRPSAMASAKFANSTVNHSQSVICNSNPVFVTDGIGAMIPRISCRVVKTLPTSTTNMTGLPIIFRGCSFLNESTIARLTICAFQIAVFLDCPLMKIGDRCHFLQRQRREMLKPGATPQEKVQISLEL